MLRLSDVHPRNGEPAIAARAIGCRLGQATVLDGVDLTVDVGQIHAVLGPNGAGKTTLIRLLSGLVQARSGTLSVAGTVGLVPSADRTFYLRISLLENLIFFGRLHGLRLREARRRAHEVLEQVGLSEVADRPAGRCSHGMQKRLSVARAVLVRPSVLLVDEATHDLDPEGARRVRALVRELARDGTAVLWTTQRVEEVRGFADAVTFLLSGRVRFTGSPDQLADLAPGRRYVLAIRGPRPGGPVRAQLQLALGGAATVSEAGGGPEHFAIALGEGIDLGQAVVRLVGCGYEVVGCRQAGAEIEEAFLALAAEAAA